MKKIKNNRFHTDEIINKLKSSLIEEIKNENKKITIAIIQVGDLHASNVYIRNKIKFCSDVGINTKHIKFKDDVTEEEVIKCISNFNDDKTVCGQMVQLPLPKRFNKRKILDMINPEKDIDGLSSKSLANILTEQKALQPCTPKAVLYLLENITTLESKTILIINDSEMLGLPLSYMLNKKKSTVIIANKFTRNLSDLTLISDIIVSGAGTPFLLKDSMIKKGSIIIDVSINKDEQGKIFGDCSLLGTSKAKIVTAVPGGIGPLTIVFLALNSLSSCKKNI